MTREELYDLMQLIPALLKTGDGCLKSQQAYDRKIHEFIAKHIEPPAPKTAEDAGLNEMCNARADQPAVAVKLEDL